MRAQLEGIEVEGSPFKPSPRARYETTLIGSTRCSAPKCNSLSWTDEGDTRHTSLQRSALAGGWTDIAAMERCYDLPGDANLVEVTSETNKRREPLPAKRKTA